jgi:hypothetical protein
MEQLVQSFIKINNRSKVLVFIGVILAYYLLFYNTANTSQNLFIAIFIFIIFTLVAMSKEENKVQKNDIDSFVHKMEEMVTQHDTQDMIVNTVYQINKPLKDLRYIKTLKEIQECLYNIRFLLIYDKEDFIDFVVLIEYFLKIHFNVMIGKYDVQTYFAILKDIRKEILNALHSSFFNIPQYSTTFDSPNLVKDMQLELKHIQAITFRYMKVLTHKYRKQLHHETYNGTLGIDPYRDARYDMFY